MGDIKRNTPIVAVMSLMRLQMQTEKFGEITAHLGHQCVSSHLPSHCDNGWSKLPGFSILVCKIFKNPPYAVPDP